MTENFTAQLSHAQQQIWTGQQLHPDEPLYNMALAFTIEGSLDAALFAQAFSHVVTTTDALRTTFEHNGQRAVRTVRAAIDFDLPVVDCGIGDDAVEQANSYTRDAAHSLLDVSTRCFDSALLRCGSDTHVWFLNQHHLIADAWSFTLVYERVAAAYATLEQGGELGIEHHPSFELLVDHEQAEVITRQASVDYWDEQSTLNVPRANLYGRAHRESSTQSTRVTREFGAQRSERLRQLVARSDIRSITKELTTFTVLASVLTSWVSRTGGQSQVGFGFFGHNRSTREFKQVAGSFVELFPITNRIEPEDSFASLIKRTSQNAMQSLRHVGIGVSEPRVTRDLNVVFNLITASLPDFGTRRVQTEWLHNGHCDVAHDVRAQFHDFDGTGDLTAVFDFKDALFDAQQRRFALDHFFQLLDACLDDSDQLVSTAPITGEEEDAALLLACTTTSPVHRDRSQDPVVRQIEAVASRYPDRVACWANGERLTYRQLDQAANALAHRLTAFERSAGGVVAVALGRSCEFVVAIVAVHKAGAAYLPIDPCDPVERRVALIESSGAFAVLVDGSGTDAGHDLEIPDLTVDLRAGIEEPPVVDVAATDRAYLIGTSGTTGVPKIIQVEHRNLSALVDGLRQVIYSDHDPGADAPLNVAVIAPFGFDPSVQQIFASLALGHRLHIVHDEARRDGGQLHTFLYEHDIDVCDGTPAHLRMLLDGSPHDVAELSTHFLIGGDVLPKPLARRFLERGANSRHASAGGLKLTNLYGPAECCVDSTAWHVRANELQNFHTVPIGRPLPGVHTSVVDEFGRLQPFGVVGELCIGGAGVGRGYLGEAGLTAAKFTDDPIRPGERRYHTGDLARMAPNGVIEFVERSDLMVKVQGYRIEIAEVENALKSYRSKRRMIPLRPAEPIRCTRCLLSDQHAGVDLVEGLCSTCRLFDEKEAELALYFGGVDDFKASLSAHARASSEYDCMLLYSGGKDSSYVLYRLAALGLRVLAFTFDNGHISDAAFENIERQTSRLNIDSVIMSAEHMDEIFLQSLNEESTVCGGCFRALTTISSQLAIARGISTVITGLSRGQIFDTKLGPLLEQGITEVDEIEDKLRVFRSGYHARRDQTSALLDIELDVLTLESMNFVDWFRYDGATTAEVLAYLQTEDSYWSQPEDTGFCSTNCRMNDIGIAVHSATKGFHNYEQPLSWDIRLGLLNREKGLLEVQPPEDRAYVEKVLDGIGYLVRAVSDAAVKVVEDDAGARQLHAFYVSNQTLTVDELRAGLAERLPGYMIPARFFRIDEIPLTANGKVDRDALVIDTERPELAAAFVAPRTDTETTLASIWTDILNIDEVGVHDSFFALGGDSIMALEVVARARDASVMITPMQVFSATTIAAIAASTDSAVRQELEDTLGQADRPPPSRSEDGGPPPFSVAEQSLLLEQSLRSGDKMFNVAVVYRVEGAVDATRFEDAMQQVVAHHEPLRWTFEAPRRELSPAEAVSCQIEPERGAGPDVDEAIERMQLLRHDLGEGPLLRALVQPLTSGDTLVSLNLHHVSVSQESVDVLWQSIANVYAGQSAVVPQIGYADLERWQSLDWDTDQAFWSNQPFGAPMQLSAAQHDHDGYLEVSSSVDGAELRIGSGRTVFATAVAAAAAATRPLFSSDEVEVSLVASTRSHELARPLVGYLLNPLPLQFEVSRNRSFGELADEVAVTTAQAMVHRTYPYARIVEDARKAGRSAPAGHVFVAISDAATLDLEGSAVHQRVRFGTSAVTDLTLFVQLRGDDVTLAAEYSARLGRASAQMALTLFDRAINALLRSPEALIASSEIDATPTSVLTGEPLADSTLLVESMLQNASRSEVAIEVGDASLSRSEMFERAVIVAEQLQRAGVARGDRVVVRTGRCVHLPVAMLGVFLAGASYVPMAANAPTQRVRDHAASVASTVEIVTSDVQPVLASVLTIDDTSCAGIAWPDSGDTLRPMPLLPTASDEAYVIFTSGSTGNANPVAITHGQLSASTNARAQVYDDRPARFAVLSGPDFDSSLVGIMWTLAQGGTIVMPTEAESHDVDRLASMLAAGSFSHALCVPTLYGLLLSRRSGTDWPQHMIVAGEACTSGLVDEHFVRVPHSRLTNEYGPTEATIWATAHECKAHQGEPPIGRPIPGMWLAVVDHAQRVLPAGVAGELVLGGPTVAAGYVSEPDHDRFVTATNIAGLPSGLPRDGRVFRTGDRAMVRDGSVDFLGRADGQINIGGVRVEPGEIEAVLVRIEGVEAAVVVAVDVRSVDDLIQQATAEELSAAMTQSAQSADPAQALRAALQGVGEVDRRLVAHVVGSADLDLASVRRQAASALGPLRQPKMYAVHADLPRTATGKIDRRAAMGLPLPVEADPAASATALDGVWPQRVRQLFSEILRRPMVDPDASFFDLGGDSLLALKLLDRLRGRHDIALPAAAVHNAPTVRLLSDRIGGGLSERGSDLSLREALHSGSLADHLPRLMVEAATAEAQMKLQTVDSVAAAMADGLRDEAHRLVRLAENHGVSSRLAPIPDRTAVPLCVVFVPRGNIEGFAAVLTAQAYQRTQLVAGDANVFVHAAMPWRVAVMSDDDGRVESDRVTNPGELGGFLGTPTGLIEPLLNFSQAQRGELIVDLGCGDGRVLVEAAQRFGMRGRGVESDPALCKIAEERVRDAGLAHLVEIVQGDAMNAAIDDADVVFAFVPPGSAAELIRQKVSRLGRGARLVVHELLEVDYPVPPTNVDVLVSPSNVPIHQAGLTVAALWASPAGLDAPAPRD